MLLQLFMRVQETVASQGLSTGQALHSLHATEHVEHAAVVGWLQGSGVVAGGRSGGRR